jgi:hypothetical protein
MGLPDSSNARRAANDAASGRDDQALVVPARAPERVEVLKNQQFAHFQMNVIFIRLPGSHPLAARIIGLILIQVARPAGWEKQSDEKRQATQ